MTRTEQIAAILAEKQEATVAQVAAALGISSQQTARNLATAHSEGVARIIRWDGPTCARPIWALGSEPHVTDRSNLRAEILALITATPASVFRLAQITGKNPNTVLKWVKDLHAEGFIRIADYRHDNGYTRCTRPAIYAAGSGPDAPNPYEQAEEPKPRTAKHARNAGPHLLTLAGQLGLLS